MDVIGLGCDRVSDVSRSLESVIGGVRFALVPRVF